MKLGFTTMNTPEDLDPADLAVGLEDRGFDSLWIGEHSHIPAVRHTPYPAGGEMPMAYTRMMDPFLSLTVAARATDELLVATGVALPLERDLFALAKAVVTLDHLSAGRVRFGVGVGWNREELADHRPELRWADRYDAMAEAVAALRALWTHEEASFEGRWFHVERAWSSPEPVQRPHPPVYVGAGGRAGTAQAAAWGDGWLPMDVSLGGPDPERVGRRLDRFADAVRDHRRSPVPVTLVAFGDPTADVLQAYRRLGVERVVVGAGRRDWDDPASTIPFLDRYATLIPELA